MMDLFYFSYHQKGQDKKTKVQLHSYDLIRPRKTPQQDEKFPLITKDGTFISSTNLSTVVKGSRTFFHIRLLVYVFVCVWVSSVLDLYIQ